MIETYTGRVTGREVKKTRDRKIRYPAISTNVTELILLFLSVFEWYRKKTWRDRQDTVKTKVALVWITAIDLTRISYVKATRDAISQQTKPLLRPGTSESEPGSLFDLPVYTDPAPPRQPQSRRSTLKAIIPLCVRTDVAYLK